jgi:hypothetical protein
MNIRYPIYEGVYRILTNHERNQYDKGYIMYAGQIHHNGNG